MERWSIREGPIIEYDERQTWLNRYANKQDSTIINYKIDNKNFIKNDLDNFIVQKSLNLLSNKLISKYDLLNENIASHALTEHNRKFIYDPIYNIHIPLLFRWNGTDSW